MKTATLNPGSREAAIQGCKCSRLMNCGGLGLMAGTVTKSGQTQYHLAADCPLHGERAHDEQRWAEFHRLVPPHGDTFVLGPVPELKPAKWCPKPTIGQRRADVLMAQVEEVAS